MDTVQTNYSMTKPPSLASRFSESVPVVLSFKPDWPLLVVFFRIVGTAMILSSAGMWLMPGSKVESDLMLIKLGVSLFFFLCGLVLLMRNHVDNQPEAYFDPIRHELRVMQKNDRGRPQVVLQRAYDSLGSVDFQKNTVVIYDVDGSLMMRLDVSDDDVRHSLRSQLSGMISVTD